MATKRRLFISRPDDGNLFDKVGGWRMLLAFGLAYACSVGIRMLEVPFWMNQSLMAGGEPMAATHDAYAYLAGVKGTSRFAADPLTHLVGFIHDLTGMPLTAVGFWLPAIMAPLAALPLCLVAGRIGRSEAGLTAGVVGTMILGFALRTRVGYLDTDVYSLFFAVGTAAAMFLWLFAACRRGLLPAWDDPPPEGMHLGRYWLEAVFIGLFIWLYNMAYSSGRPIIWAILLVSLLAAMVFSKPGNRMPLLVGLGIIVGIWAFRSYGLLVSLVVVGLAFFRPRLFYRYHIGLILGCGVLVFFLAMRLGEVSFLVDLAKKYLQISEKVKGASGETSNLSLPGVIQSVREAARVNITGVVETMAGRWSIFIAGLAGFLFVLLRWPLMIVFLPLLLLGLASIKMGIRFTMYGGAALGIGLGFGVSEFMYMMRQSPVRRWILQAAISAVLVLFFGNMMNDMRPMPVLSSPFAQTFIDLKRISEPRAFLWQWWDYGYAAQYYAERDTMGDGGRHSGDFLYPLGLVHSTDSPRQAAQAMKYFAEERFGRIEEYREQGRKPYPPARFPFYGINPMQGLERMGPQKADAFIESLRYEDYEADRVDIPEQYFVVAWDNLPLGNWISRFGNWDLQSGQKPSGHISQINGEFNLARGLLKMDGQILKVSELKIITENGMLKHHSWQHSDGVYCLANRLTRQIFMMDRKMYNSMMVRMLIGDPRQFSEHFELVVDRAPWARAYRVREAGN
jgi:dolichyl-diphosphooligosaccharide--protein glycosyltransferase